MGCFTLIGGIGILASMGIFMGSLMAYFVVFFTSLSIYKWFYGFHDDVSIMSPW
jgi:hypothetical protein